jgi:hypothetical protein
MASLTRVTTLLAVAGLLAWAPAVFAAAPTQADFDACNREAQARQSTPSASPSTGGSPSGGSLSSTGGISTGGSTMMSPGSADANRQPNASGAISGSAGSPGTGSGTVGGGLSGGSTTSGATGMGVSGSTSAAADVRLQQGMAAAGASNEVYAQAYRDCMKRRGF